MFVNTQHPGNGDPARTSYPAPAGSGLIPRDTTFVITRRNGGIIGS
jgi:secreted PhoX family phosphatase